MQLTGYCEGYYGQCLSWASRHRVLEHLADIGMNTYLLAPKDDVFHRWQWRTPYPDSWRTEFRTFCTKARSLGIDVIAGIAPGLDFDFGQLPGQDLTQLSNKATQLLADGAARVALLLDDIDDDFAQRAGHYESEGCAHAALGNALGKAIDVARLAPGVDNDAIHAAAPQSILMVPRAYAGEIAQTAPDYLPEFAAELDTRHDVMLCGEHIVSEHISDSFSRHWQSRFSRPLVMWDNLYANDYCPRRLFVGPWLNRDTDASVLLNPTGKVETDLLLLSVMALTRQRSDPMTAWTSALQRHQVPDAFLPVARYLCHPVFSSNVSRVLSGEDVTPIGMPEASMPDTMAALETLLWQWKSSLAIEWYPHLMGLKHDLQLQQNALSPTRIAKTQLLPLCDVLRSR